MQFVLLHLHGLATDPPEGPTEPPGTAGRGGQDNQAGAAGKVESMGGESERMPAGEATRRRTAGEAVRNPVGDFGRATRDGDTARGGCTTTVATCGGDGERRCGTLKCPHAGLPWQTTRGCVVKLLLVGGLT